MRLFMRRHDAVIVAVGAIVSVLLLFYLSYSGEFSTDRVQDYLLVGALGILVAYAIWEMTQLLDRLIPWKIYPSSRLLVGIFTNSLVAIGLSFFLPYIFYLLVHPGISLLIAYPDEFLKLAILLFFFVLIYSIIYFALFSFYQYNKGQVDSIKQERKQIGLQLRALKAQLSPHFLFNSLNTISSLMAKDVSKAEVFIRNLASSYQYTLSTYEEKWVSLKEELAFVSSYQFLLQTRFEEHLRFTVDIPEQKLFHKVPPLTLQMLVENAVKHNQLLPEEPLHIEIGMDEKWVWVRNNKTKPPKQVPSFKIGLKNIQSRYQLLINKDIQVEDSDFFTVKLPLVS